MCLIVIAWQESRRFPLILAANRDEYFQRPSEAARFWSDDPRILGGRDLVAGGTWLGVDRRGRFTAVTNIREPPQQREGVRSRGLLASEYLGEVETPGAYVQKLALHREQYDAFNFIAGDPGELWFLNSRGGEARRLPAGVYGVSNGDLDCPWPKVETGKREMRRLLNAGISANGDRRPLPAIPAEAGIRTDDLSRGRAIITDGLFELLASRSIPADDQLPDTGVGIEWERILAPICIRAGRYGTRSSTVLIVQADGSVHFMERTFDAAGRQTGEAVHAFQISR